ncbi:MAG: pirin family protein [Patescibacteria group bacterium]
MQTIIHHAEDRGKGDYAWLTTRYSFSFANWYDPKRLGFGALLVINDDRIEPEQGFGTHQHENMEIITIVTSGTLTHKDSMGNVGTIGAGEVQVMSAGTGVAHSEYNASETEPLMLFQIWIRPNVRDVEPRYDQKQFPTDTRGFTKLVGPVGSSDSLGIHQDAYITSATLAAGDSHTYDIRKEGNGIYAFVVSGTPAIAGVPLRARDALGITETDSFELTADTPAQVLLIEVPI